MKLNKKVNFWISINLLILILVVVVVLIYKTLFGYKDPLNKTFKGYSDKKINLILESYPECYAKDKGFVTELETSLSKLQKFPNSTYKYTILSKQNATKKEKLDAYGLINSISSCRGIKFSDLMNVKIKMDIKLNKDTDVMNKFVTYQLIKINNKWYIYRADENK